MKVTCDESGIKIAVETISNGGIVVFPTDTVYGIGCDPYNVQSVESIYKIKKRELTYSLPVLGFSKEEISKIAEFDKKSSILAEKFWPGQLTLILKIKDQKIKKNLRLNNSIAVRVPNNKCVMKILKKCKLLVGTSANISGKQSHVNPEKCMRGISGYDVFVDDGTIISKGESTIIENINGKLKIHRMGAISEKEISDLF